MKFQFFDAEKSIARSHKFVCIGNLAPSVKIINDPIKEKKSKCILLLKYDTLGLE